MRISRVHLENAADGQLSFSEVSLRRVNLLVGASAAGKTRFLNSLFSGARLALGNDRLCPSGSFEYEFEEDGAAYRWQLECGQENGSRAIVKSERLERLSGTNDGSRVIIDRTGTFRYMGREMPVLERDKSAVSLFKDDPAVSPVYRGFAKIMRRDFSHQKLSMTTDFSLNATRLQGSKRIDTLEDLFGCELPPNIRLDILSTRFGSVFNDVCKYFSETFPFIAECRMMDFNKLGPIPMAPEYVPVFCIKERSLHHWIPIQHCASGMQKVLLILTDLLSLNEGCIYLIDEYENSLGVNAIDFLPSFLTALDRDLQLLITTHHPYLINQIPIDDWQVFRRAGAKVTVTSGLDLKARYGKSRQEHFTQLINDNYYRNGVE